MGGEIGEKEKERRKTLVSSSTGATSAPFLAAISGATPSMTHHHRTTIHGYHASHRP
ncbi:hypothetical protein U1Q18_036552, partial [Sarracenia purpurea var. burkii]